MEFPIRLNKYLALCGLGSRRACDKLVATGKIAINGIIATHPATQVHENDKVTFESNPLTPLEGKVYLMFNKPKGIVCTHRDPHVKKTIYDFLPRNLALKSVGRLDKDTTGALIITNDGDLIHRLTHPSYQISREYRVRLDREFDPALFHRIEEGVQIGDKISRGKARYLNRKEKSRIHLTLKEGFKREVKLLFKALGYDVLDLHRETFAGLGVRNLAPGEWRKLDDTEQKLLKSLVELN